MAEYWDSMQVCWVDPRALRRMKMIKKMKRRKMNSTHPRTADSSSRRRFLMSLKLAGSYIIIKGIIYSAEGIFLSLLKKNLKVDRRCAIFYIKAPQS